jgi:hypothetical protein
LSQELASDELDFRYQPLYLVGIATIKVLLHTRRLWAAAEHLPFLPFFLHVLSRSFW